jgi:hypothetical protein
VAPTEIFVKLLDEGTDCWRPVNANPIGDGVFEVLGIEPFGETWEFAPGTHVRCQQKQFANGSIGLTAIKLAAGTPQSGRWPWSAVGR